MERVPKELLFVDAEVFYNQHGRHSTSGRIGPAAIERRAEARQAAALRGLDPIQA